MRIYTVGVDHLTAGSRALLLLGVTLLLSNTTASAQSDQTGVIVSEPDTEGKQAEPSSIKPEAGATESPQEAQGEPSEEKKPSLFLSEFLFAIRIGPFFSFGQWAGALGEIEFEFKLRDFGYLSLLSSINGGYQIDFERGDYLFSETLGYRHYFPRSQEAAWTILAGGSFGYFTTTKGQTERGYNWMHVGLKAKGEYHFLADERLSIGVGAGLTLAYQFSEFIDADSFVVLIPEASVSLLF
jgi:hypothetical protein